MMRAFSSLSAPLSLRSASESAAEVEDAPLSTEQPAAARSNAASAAARKRVALDVRRTGLIVSVIEYFDIRRIREADCGPTRRLNHSTHHHPPARQGINLGARRSHGLGHCRGHHDREVLTIITAAIDKNDGIA